MKKFAPVILLVVGILVIGLVFIVVKKAKTNPSTVAPIDSSEPVVEIAQKDKPQTSLIPSADGHWLKLKVEGIKMNADSMDYELLYTIADGRQQGVPGTTSLKGQTSIDRDLLLGSESSGKFRYDAGVENGTLTLKFRDSNGKLIGKLTTDFKLENGKTELASADGNFKFTLDKADTKTFFTVMQTFGLPGDVTGTLDKGPYGIFASDTKDHLGKVNMGGSNISKWQNNSWTSVDSTTSTSIGVFITTK